MRRRLSLILFAVVVPVSAQAQAEGAGEPPLKTIREGYCIRQVLDTVRQEVITKAYPCEQKGFDLAEWTKAPETASEDPVPTSQTTTAERTARCAEIARMEESRERTLVEARNQREIWACPPSWRRLLK